MDSSIGDEGPPVEEDSGLDSTTNTMLDNDSSKEGDERVHQDTYSDASFEDEHNEKEQVGTGQ